MKQTRWQYLWQLMLFLVLLLAGFAGMLALLTRYQASFPEMQTFHPYWGLTVILVLVALAPLPLWLCRRISGYTILGLHFPFLHVEKQANGWKARPVRSFRTGVVMLPPRVDGASPWKLVVCCHLLYLMAAGTVLAALTALCWRTPLLPALLTACFSCWLGLAVVLRPRRDGSGVLTTLRRMRDQEYRRTWEVGMHINQAIWQERSLLEMPDEWFRPVPDELLCVPNVSVYMVNVSSRLLRQERYQDSYAQISRLLPLTEQPTHDQYALMRNSSILVIGALDEAVAQLPPKCLHRLDDPAVRYMLPDHWRTLRLLADYARALLVTHDDAAVEKLLTELTPAIAGHAGDELLLRRIQEVAGAAGEKELPQ